MQFFLTFFLIFSVFLHANKDENETCTFVTYAGLSMECHEGCNDPEEDPAKQELIELLEKTVRKIFVNCAPLSLKDTLISSWEYEEGTGECTVYDWKSTKGFYIENFPHKTYTVTTHAQFLEMAEAMRADLQFYYYDLYLQELNLYRSFLSPLKSKQENWSYAHVDFTENGKLEFLESGGRYVYEVIPELQMQIETLEENLIDHYPQVFSKKQELLEKGIEKIDAKFREIFVWCLENHQPEGIAFHAALENFIGGDFETAFEQILWLIEQTEKHQVKDELLSKLYLLKGQIQSEFGLFADAIIGLTTAIQKNPSMKEAYFERASAHFELGQFDLAVEDYLASEIRPKPDLNPTQLGLGITAGIIHGAGESALEFIPSMLGTLRGLTSGLWALTKDPLGASREFCNAAIQCMEYLKSHTQSEILQNMVPELKSLVQNYDQLSDFERGKLIGHVIGKYGMDIFLAKESATFIKAYRDLKKANQVMTLEALVSSETSQSILIETNKRWHSIHREDLRNGIIKIHPGKQGKHIEGHPNYNDLLMQNKNPSLFVHSEPNKLLKEFGGTGIKDKGDILGTAGYREIVDFKQFIGYAVDLETGMKIKTTMGKIHYAKDGAHIVPYVKKSR